MSVIKKNRAMSAPTGSVPSEKMPLVFARDVVFAALLPLLFPFAWLAPDRLRHAAASFAARLIHTLLPGAVSAKMQRMSPTFDVADSGAFFRDVVTISYYEILQLLNSYAPWHRPPAIRLEGREHLDRAYSNGKGVILWVAPSTFGPVLTKGALKDGGVAVWHLSRPTHGFSTSAFGVAVLNPIRIHAENRYLAERIVIYGEQVRPALEKITECLNKNRVVSITVGDNAKIVQRVPFIRGTMTIAVRPIDLARSCGAALLPVVTVRGENGEYVTRIGTPLPVDADDKAARALAAFVEPFARQSPEQFAQFSAFRPAEFVKSRVEEVRNV